MSDQTALTIGAMLVDDDTFVLLTAGVVACAYDRWTAMADLNGFDVTDYTALADAVAFAVRDMFHGDVTNIELVIADEDKFGTPTAIEVRSNDGE